LAKSIPDFWRRWHISLSTWFKDYVYFSLGGNRVSIPRWYINIMVVFIISGFWHGASWNFVIWGALHGVFQLVGIELSRRFPRLSPEKAAGIYLRIFQVWTFALVTIAWIFFRLQHFSEIKMFAKRLCVWHVEAPLGMHINEIITSLGLIMGLLIWDSTEKPMRYNVWLLPIALVAIYFLGVFSLKQFIYFQF